jgi:hypothetical protein
VVTIAWKKPCHDCPWRRESAPGWLGGYDADWFTDHIRSELPLVCHTALGNGHYDHLSDEEKREQVPLCAGSLIVQKNMCKIPRNPDLASAVKEVERNPSVFNHPQEFLNHHGH